jgi:hypothetical protein
MSETSDSQQGAAGIAGGLASGLAGGLESGMRRTHETRMEMMAALRMAKYGGMYGGGGTANMVPGPTMHAMDPNWPIDRPAPPQVYEGWVNAKQGRQAPAQVAAGANEYHTDAETQAQQAAAAEKLRATQTQQQEVAHQNALKAVEAAGEDLSTENGQKIYSNAMNSYGATQHFPPISFTTAVPDPHWYNKDATTTQFNPGAYQGAWLPGPVGQQPGPGPVPGQRPAPTPVPTQVPVDPNAGYSAVPVQ